MNSRGCIEWIPGQGLWLDINGVRLEGRCWGPPPQDALTVVLLHEGLGCVALWKGFPEQLVAATGMGVFAFSRQGYGASDPCALPRPVDYMEREADQVLGSVLNAVGIRQAVLIGHSDGGSIAALYGGMVCDSRLQGLVLMAPHFFVEDVSIEAIEAARDAYETGGLRSRLERHHAHVEAAFRGWNDAWLNPEFRDWDISGYLQQINVPVLALQGKDDPYGTAAQVNVIARRMDDLASVHLLGNCQHAPHLDQTDVTLDLIRNFVERGLGRSPDA